MTSVGRTLALKPVAGRNADPLPPAAPVSILPLPSCPAAFMPQQLTPPASLTMQVWRNPTAKLDVGFRDSGVGVAVGVPVGVGVSVGMGVAVGVPVFVGMPVLVAVGHPSGAQGVGVAQLTPSPSVP